MTCTHAENLWPGGCHHISTKNPGNRRQTADSRELQWPKAPPSSHWILSHRKQTRLEIFDFSWNKIEIQSSVANNWHSGLSKCLFWDQPVMMLRWHDLRLWLVAMCVSLCQSCQFAFLPWFFPFREHSLAFLEAVCISGSVSVDHTVQIFVQVCWIGHPQSCCQTRTQLVMIWLDKLRYIPGRDAVTLAYFKHRFQKSRKFSNKKRQNKSIATMAKITNKWTKMVDQLQNSK